jgi:hypothetical protein
MKGSAEEGPNSLFILTLAVFLILISAVIISNFSDFQIGASLWDVLKNIVLGFTSSLL